MMGEFLVSRNFQWMISGNINGSIVDTYIYMIYTLCDRHITLTINGVYNGIYDQIDIIENSKLI